MLHFGTRSFWLYAFFIRMPEENSKQFLYIKCQIPALIITHHTSKIINEFVLESKIHILHELLKPSVSERTIRFLPRLLADFFFFFFITSVWNLTSRSFPHMAVGSIWPRYSNCAANTEKPYVKTQQESATYPQTSSCSAVPHLWEHISYSKEPTQCASKTNRADTEERIVCAHSTNKCSVLFSTAPCCLIQLAFNRSINAYSKVRFNYIQENMHTEFLQSDYFLL